MLQKGEVLFYLEIVLMSTGKGVFALPLEELVLLHVVHWLIKSNKFDLIRNMYGIMSLKLANLFFHLY